MKISENQLQLQIQLQIQVHQEDHQEDAYATTIIEPPECIAQSAWDPTVYLAHYHLFHFEGTALQETDHPGHSTLTGHAVAGASLAPTASGHDDKAPASANPAHAGSDSSSSGSSSSSSSSSDSDRESNPARSVEMRRMLSAPDPHQGSGTAAKPSPPVAAQLHSPSHLERCSVCKQLETPDDNECMRQVDGSMQCMRCALRSQTP